MYFKQVKILMVKKLSSSEVIHDLSDNLYSELIVAGS